MNLYIGKFTNGEAKFRTMLMAENEDHARALLTAHIQSNCHYFSTNVITMIVDSVQIAEITMDEEAVLCVEARRLNPVTGNIDTTTIMALTDADDDITDKEEDDSSDEVADNNDALTSDIIAGYQNAFNDFEHDRRCETFESM